MSAASEFDINMKLLDEAMIKLKPLLNNHMQQSSLNKATLAAVIELQALATYVEKGAANQPRRPPEGDDFDMQVWKALQTMEDEATSTDLAQSQFNKLFNRHQKDILSLANINPSTVTCQTFESSALK